MEFESFYYFSLFLLSLFRLSSFVKDSQVTVVICSTGFLCFDYFINFSAFSIALYNSHHLLISSCQMIHLFILTPFLLSF